MADLREEVAELRREVRELRDRQAILDCINTYCRGLDRLDPELLGSTYHAGALDRHGPFYGTREEFVPWAIELCGGFPSTHHSVTSHTCRIEGDNAYAETYCIFFTLMPDGSRLGCGAARYIDQLERRSGTWAIVARCEIMDCAFELQRSSWLGGAWEEVPARRDRQDLSYHRPLRVPQPSSK
jgi:hypothetical protein